MIILDSYIDVPRTIDPSEGFEKVILESWGQELILEAGKLYVVTFRGPDQDVFVEEEIHDNNILVLYGWTGCVVRSITENGVELMPSDDRSTPLPPTPQIRR